MQIEEEGFRGCLRDIKILTQTTPVEVWTPLNWSAAIYKTSALPAWQGCPMDMDIGLHLFGSGFYSTLDFTIYIYYMFNYLFFKSL